MAVYMLAVLNGIAAPPAPPRLSITVTGYQWWWEAVYDGDDPARRFATANEIHIPAGEPVLFRLRSADVIHAFWVPALGGKTQMIPGQINRQWLQADKPGVYRGQCVQYCGVQHAHMGFEIVAQPPEEFRAWERAQRAKARALPAAGKIPAGARLFLQACAACHTVRGSAAAGAHGPDLTHLASRRSIAAALLPNTAENLRRWILHAQGMKPGVRMPDFPLTARQRDALVAYLQSLK
jgi:cytochrome c oxidase subunit 2